MPVSRSVLGVADMKFDPDGRILATAAMGGKVQLWDVATHHPIGPPITSDSGDPAQVVALAGQLARERGCARLWVITTNDITDALRFYQRRGFCLVAMHRGAVDRSRARLKPEIPAVGAYGIPLRDEIELEKQP